MYKLGLDHSWVSLIMSCVSSVSFSIIINGETKGHITPSRGLRQGDHLSPDLVLLYSEGFSQLLHSAVSRCMISGISLAPSAPIISHLFFADYRLLFCKASMNDFFVLKGILHDYENASGQSVNFHKSGMFFSPNISNDFKIYIKSYLNISIVNNLGAYLDLPINFSRNKCSDFAFLKGKVWKTVQGWKTPLFSSTGREILIKSVAQAIPSYVMSCFRLPKKLCKEVGQYCARFWWGGSV